MVINMSNRNNTPNRGRPGSTWKNPNRYRWVSDNSNTSQVEQNVNTGNNGKSAATRIDVNIHRSEKRPPASAETHIEANGRSGKAPASETHVETTGRDRKGAANRTRIERNEQHTDSRSGTRVEANRSGNTNCDYLEAGTVVDGRFQIVSAMGGSGAEAALYVAVDTQTGKEICLKIYRDETHIRRDVRDALLQVRHPNVAELLAYGTWERTIYEVWTLYQGEGLDQILSKGCLNEAVFKKYLSQMNLALNAIHEARIVHQDVKPANILITTNGVAVLIDFGVSALLEQGRDTARTHVTIVGHTAEYAAPESADGYSWEASDYYSLGIVFFEALTGRTPFSHFGENEATAKIMAQVTVKLPRIEKYSKAMQHLFIGLLQYERVSKDNLPLRWGYEAVSAWLKGDYAKYVISPSKSQSALSAQGTHSFNGKNFTLPDEIPQLVVELAYHWENGLLRMNSDNGSFPLLSTDFAKVGATELHDICNRHRDVTNKAVSYHHFLYELYPKFPYYAWRGFVAQNSQELGNAILGALWEEKNKTVLGRSASAFAMERQQNTLSFAELKEMFVYHTISDYLSRIGSNKRSGTILEYENQVIQYRGAPEIGYYRTAYALSGSTKLLLGGAFYSDLNALLQKVNHEIEAAIRGKNNDSFINFYHSIFDPYSRKTNPGFIAWAEAIGIGDKVTKLQAALGRLEK